jgi:hypothetical protein
MLSDLASRVAVLETQMTRLPEDLRELKTQVSTLQTHLNTQGAEFRALANKGMGAFFVLQIIVPLVLKFIFKS